MGDNKVYVAVSKNGGRILTGARGQTGFASVSGLHKSMYQRFKYSDVNHRDLYFVYELTQGVVQIYGTKVEK